VLGLAPKAAWSARYDHINDFERLLHDCGTRVVKLYLHVSKDEQARRLQDRVDDPKKRWKFDPRDLEMRARWDDFQEAYEDALSRCSTEEAPWWVVPADNKWYRDLCVARILVELLEDMGPRYPRATFDPASIVIR
jgi:polyphosphate kinase 2 (PPK2 family)